jgi:hypothetical protein
MRGRVFAVNSMFTIFNKSGTKLYGPANGNTDIGA